MKANLFHSNSLKKILNVVLVLVMFVSVLPVSTFAAAAEESVPTGEWKDYAAETFQGGKGTQAEPYLIGTAEQLAKLSSDITEDNSYEGVYFQLTDDIDLTAHIWNPIGVYHWGFSSSVSKPFKGLLDGNEKSITGLYVDERTSGHFAGLFGYIRGTTSETPNVCDLTIVNAKIYASDENCNETKAGILVGEASTNDTDSMTFENIKVSGTITCEADYGCVIAGGVVGYAERTRFTDCDADSVTLSGSGNMGGFVGMDGECVFEDCSAKGTITGFWALGGFSGYSWDATGSGGDDIVQSTFNYCYADVDITASEWRAGGFVGYAEGGKYNNCVAMGNVSSTVTEWEPKVGGFVGEIVTAKIEKCHASGIITSASSTSKAGGFIGYDNAGNIGAVTNSSFDNEKNPTLNAVGVADEAGQHTIVGASSKVVSANICRDYYGNTTHKYDNSADLTCNSCGFTRFSGEIRIHNIDLVNGEDDHTLELGEGTAVYDPKTQTLTLTKAKITEPSGTNVYAGIYISGFQSDVTIKLVDENNIELTDSAYVNLGIFNYSKHGLNIEGSGKLDVKLLGGTFGIMNRDGNVHIEGVNLNFELLDGSVTNGYLIDSNYSVSLKQATLTADGFMMGISGIKDVTIEKSEVTLNMLESGVYSDGNIQIADSTLNFTGEYEGLCAWGKTTVTNSELDLNSWDSNAIYSYGSLEISGGSATLVAQNATAVYVNGGILIDGATVVIDGQNGHGIYTDEIVNLKSGTISVKGSEQAICATRVSANDLNTKPTDSSVALVIGEGYAEENGYSIHTDDWEIRTVWDSGIFEHVDKWQSISCFADKDGNKVKEIRVVAFENDADADTDKEADSPLSGEANKETASPKTGDNSTIFLGIAFFFISGSAMITLTVYDRRKRAVKK